MLEAAIAVGLTTGVALDYKDSVIERWSATGSIPKLGEQRAWPLFMDCSGSADPALRDFSEQSSFLVREQTAQVSSVADVHAIARFLRHR